MIQHQYFKVRSMKNFEKEKSFSLVSKNSETKMQSSLHIIIT